MRLATFGIIIPLLLIACSGMDSSASPSDETDTQAAQSDICTQIQSDGMACYSDGTFVILGDSKTAGQLAPYLSAQSAKFETQFSAKPRKTAIVMGGTISSELAADLKSAGYPLALPWLSKSDRADIKQSQIIRQIEAQTAGMSDAQKEAILAQALAQLPAQSKTQPTGQPSETELGALAHELAHIWFIDSFQDERKTTSGGHGYGGWAPDWLDEAVAVSFENETLKKGRAKTLAEAQAAGTLYPLSEFFTMEHPSAKAARDIKAMRGSSNAAGGAKLIVLSGKDAAEFMKNSDGDPVIFYAQAYGVTDYLTARTGQTHILSDIAAHLHRGENWESWLSQSAGLPNTPEALQADWEMWLSQLP